MKVKCNSCNYEFDLDIKTQSFLGRREEYYICPLCKEKYVIAIHNIKTDRLKKEIDDIRSKKRKTKEDQEKLKDKLLELKIEMDKLNNK